jgi:hypothetical protein
MFKICLHKWIEIDKQPKYKYLKCKKCNKIKTIELFKGGYQPKKNINMNEIKLEDKVKIINVSNIPDHIKQNYDYTNIINKIGAIKIIDKISDNNIWYLVEMPYKYLLNQNENCIHADNCYIPFLKENFILV